jgi:probable F420-dependent oxidoreductase
VVENEGEEKRMQVGIHSAFHAGSVDLAKFAARCEALGFESLWLPEHSVIPVHPSVGPRGVPGAPIPDSYVLMVDPLIGLTVAATVTQTLRLGTGVCLIPQHHPVDLAKRIASLDLYSKGRFILGTGTGWQPEESAALGGDFPHRWVQTAEALTIMDKLWTEPEPEHAGTYYRFPPMRFHPQPVQRPRPPILLGGTAPKVFQRAAALADGWAPWMIAAEGLAVGRHHLRRAFEKAGRDPGTAQVTAFVSSSDTEVVEQYQAAGADRLVFTMGSSPAADPFGRLETLAQVAGL